MYYRITRRRRFMALIMAFVSPILVSTFFIRYSVRLNYSAYSSLTPYIERFNGSFFFTFH